MRVPQEARRRPTRLTNHTNSIVPMNRILLIAGISLALALFAGISSANTPDETAPVAAAHGGHGEPAPDLNPLTWRTDTAVWTAVVFILLVGVLGRFAFKPIVEALDAREKSVADNIASAESMNLEAKNTLKQYQQKLDEARDEVRGILDNARKDAQRNADGIIEKAKEAAHLEGQRAQKEIEAQTDLALQQLAEKSATLATELAGKMIRAEVKPEQHRDLIQNALNEFAKN